jgi:hypothetical protein
MKVGREDILNPKIGNERLNEVISKLCDIQKSDYSRRMIRAEQVARMGEKRILVGKPEGRRH